MGWVRGKLPIGLGITVSGQADGCSDAVVAGATDPQSGGCRVLEVTAAHGTQRVPQPLVRIGAVLGWGSAEGDERGDDAGGTDVSAGDLGLDACESMLIREISADVGGKPKLRASSACHGSCPWDRGVAYEGLVYLPVALQLAASSVRASSWSTRSG
jgi:hypothetical protein